MTFAYMDGGRWVVQLLQGLTTDMVSLYDMCIPATLVEYSGPVGKKFLQKRDHVSHSYVGVTGSWYHGYHMIRMIT